MRLDRTKFEAWLKAKPPTEIVGRNRDCNCPLAKFYREISGRFAIVIFDGSARYMIDRGYSKRPLPAWAICFAWEIDDDGERQVTARRALEVLHSLTLGYR